MINISVWSDIDKVASTKPPLLPLLTCLVTRPSPFLSMFLNSFSIWDSSPMNSSKLNLPSKSRSMELKNSSTSSLIKKTIFSPSDRLYFFLNQKFHTQKKEKKIEKLKKKYIKNNKKQFFSLSQNKDVASLLALHHRLLIILHCCWDPRGVEDLPPLLWRQLPVLVLVRLVEHPSDLPRNKYWKYNGMFRAQSFL